MNNLFYRKNKLFYRKKLLPESFRKKVLPVEHKLFFRKKVLPEDFRKNLLPKEEIIFFNARTILPIHLIAGCTSNVAGAPSMSQIAVGLLSKGCNRFHEAYPLVRSLKKLLDLG